MKIKDMKNKVKIIFDYSKKSIGWGTITREDLEKLFLRVFLDDGTEVNSSEIKQITFRLKEESS